jgi:hypothetical protein
MSAVFVSASDESSGKDRRDPFVFAGLIANESDWSEIFSPAWQRLLLDGPPKIDYLHMVDMRSPKWRIENGLSDEDAFQRIDRAVEAIGVSSFLFPIGLKVSGGDICDAFEDVKIKTSGRKSSNFEPDYLCFLGYAMLALDYVARHHPECEKLDFVVERNGKITDYIREFHADIGRRFIELGRPDLARFVGELIPSGKDSALTQAADVLCWHTARYENRRTMDKDDWRRYETLARRTGHLETLSSGTIKELAKLLLDPSEASG